MLNPISASLPVAHSQPAAPQAAPQSAPAASKVAEDTVSISSAAQKASHSTGDVDHDGDSH